MKIEREWPTLVSAARTGKLKYWKVRVETECPLNGSGVHAFVVREWWLAEGQHQTASREIRGKNLGRSNETTPTAQALLEADAEHKKQLDDGYQVESETIPGVGPVYPAGNANTQTGLLLPMLAHDFTKRGKSLDWSAGVWAQPKLDGFRCLYNSEIGFWSRGGKPFSGTVDLGHLGFLTHGLTFDGELILPPPYTFQQTCAAIKKQRPETALLEFHIFDVVLPDEPFTQRNALLAELFVKHTLPEQVVKVQTFTLDCIDDAARSQAAFMEQGYEGLILRSAGGKYDVGNRSPDLLKLKVFEDAEFQILGLREGVGKEAGAAIFTCGISTSAGLREFDVRPRGSYELRQLWWQQREELIGRFLTVRYQSFSDEGIPRFPVGIVLRDLLPAGQPSL